MNEIEFLRKMAAAAEREPIPDVDVARKVISELTAYEPEVYRPFAWIAGLATAAALPIVFLAVHALSVLNDPFLQIFMMFGWVPL